MYKYLLLGLIKDFKLKLEMTHPSLSFFMYLFIFQIRIIKWIMIACYWEYIIYIYVPILSTEAVEYIKCTLADK